MQCPESSRVADTLAHQAEQGADATQIADAIVATWLAVDAALRPIIGQGGVTALYSRCLHLTPTYPWLADSHAGGVNAPLDFTALHTLLVQRGSVDAAAGGGALLKTFYELLANLVGPSLTERLLRAAWSNSFNSPLAQDTP